MGGPGPTPERFDLDLKERKLGLSSKDLPLLFIIAALAVGLYLAFQALTTNQERAIRNQEEGFRQLANVLAGGQVTQQVIITELQRRTDKLEVELHAQNTLLASQTAQLTTNQQGITESTRQQTEQIRHWLALIVYKMEHPDEPIALDIPIPVPRGRQ